MSSPRFRRVQIGELPNDVGPSPMNTFFRVADLNGDGRPDVLLAGRDGRAAWFENTFPTEGVWPCHDIGPTVGLECGGLVAPLGSRNELVWIAGGDWRSDELAWWGPGAEGEWRRHLIARTGRTKFHDAVLGDATGEGPSLFVWNQGESDGRGATLLRFRVPDDLHQWGEPEVVVEGCKEGGFPDEGLALADLDGDGQLELVAGTFWLKFDRAQRTWERHQFAPNPERPWISTVVAVGDADGDGELEIALAEGDACLFGRSGGRVAWFKRGQNIRAPWTEHLLSDELLEPHTLAWGDAFGRGHLDLLVGEIGTKALLQARPPRLWIYENDGRGHFSPLLVDEGTGTHHGIFADLRGTGRLDIVSRPLLGEGKWKLFAWLNED